MSEQATPDSEQVHGSVVVLDDKGCLITGASGSGKSTLALEMIALGCSLVTDDRADIQVQDGRVIASVPDTIEGAIEASGAGLMKLPHQASACIDLIVDMDQTELRRLPGPRKRDLLGTECPVIFGRGRPGLAAILCLVLRHGLEETP